MLIFDKRIVGNKLLKYRKKAGLTQAELAEAAGLADRTYADIERGTANMRIETLLHICEALSITPNDILTDETPLLLKNEELLKQLEACGAKEKQTALGLLEIFFGYIK